MNVQRLADGWRGPLEALLGRYGLQLDTVPDGRSVPGSYWGDEEAGLVGGHVYARSDTPVHSVLHETCHYVCMTPARRAGLHTDAGGDYAEENAVCYLQILLGGMLPGFGRRRMCADMDAWGYTFRLGSADAWFRDDADDAREWLFHRGLIDPAARPSWQLATEPAGLTPPTRSTPEAANP